MIAPEDSSLWKCNWIECEAGGGLAGHGYCFRNGNWQDQDCAKWKEATCQHNVKVGQECPKCQKLNAEIETRIGKRT